MLKFCMTVNNGIEPLRKLSTYTAAPLFDLAIRLYTAWFFFKSGLIKFGAFANGDFNSVIGKFTDFYPVELFGHAWDPTISAYGAMAGELILPVLLALGLFGRFAAFGLMIMVAVITFGTDNAVFFESLVLFVMTGTLFLKGVGFFSLDYILVNFLRARSATIPKFAQQLGLVDIDTDILGHEKSGRFIRGWATGFWYNIFAGGVLLLIINIINLIPGLDLSSLMVTDIFARTSPDTILCGYVWGIVIAYLSGLFYAITSKKLNMVYTPKKSALFAIISAIIFIIFHAIAIA